QFEVGPDRVGPGGVVRDPALRGEAVVDVARDGGAYGCVTRGVVASPLPGPSGNVEFFVWLRKVASDGQGAAPADSGAGGAEGTANTANTANTVNTTNTAGLSTPEAPDEGAGTPEDIEDMVRRAVEEGPV